MVTCGGDRTCFLAISVKLQKMDGEVEFVPCNILLASTQLHTQLTSMHFYSTQNLTNLLAMPF